MIHIENLKRFKYWQSDRGDKHPLDISAMGCNRKSRQRSDFKSCPEMSSLRFSTPTFQILISHSGMSNPVKVFSQHLVVNLPDGHLIRVGLRFEPELGGKSRQNRRQLDRNWCKSLPGWWRRWSSRAARLRWGRSNGPPLRTRWSRQTGLSGSSTTSLSSESPLKCYSMSTIFSKPRTFPR